MDSAPAITTALRIAFSKCGVELDPTQDLNSFVGPPLDRMLARVIPEPDTVARVLKVYRQEYSRIIEVSTPLMPSADDAVRAFSEAGARLGVVTYKPTPLAEVVLAGAGLRSLFDLVVGTIPGEASRCKAELLQEALIALRPFRRVPVYVGDHAEDREAAARCGVAFIAYGPNNWRDIMRRVFAT